MENMNSIPHELEDKPSPPVGNNSPTTGNTSEKSSNPLLEAKEKLMNETQGMGTKITETLDKTKTDTTKSLQAVSKNLDKAATYLNENDYKDMLDHSAEVVKKHPGKSLLVGIGLGILLGKVMK